MWYIKLYKRSASYKLFSDFKMMRGDGRVVQWCWVNFQCWGVLLIWIRVGQGPTALAVDAGGGCLEIFFSRLSFLFSFSLSLGDGRIYTEILSQRAVKPKTTNNQQPTNQNDEKIWIAVAHPRSSWQQMETKSLICIEFGILKACFFETSRNN